MKIHLFWALSSLTITAIAITPVISSCSNAFASELYASAEGVEFYNDITSKDFMNQYVSPKGEPRNYSSSSSNDVQMCKTINTLIKPRDMIFLMAYDIYQMFQTDKTSIETNCSDVTLYVGKYNDNGFDISEHWTDASYTWADDSKGARCVAHTIDETLLSVSSVGMDADGALQIVFSPITSKPKISIDHYSTGDTKQHQSDSKDRLVYTLPLSAWEKLFPGYKMPILV